MVRIKAAARAVALAAGPAFQVDENPPVWDAEPAEAGKRAYVKDEPYGLGGMAERPIRALIQCLAYL